ncbi:YhgE/Pip family protein [Streptococcus cameli]
MKKLKIRHIQQPMLVITIIGLIFIPTLYNIIFLSSMWDPYGSVSNLPVAVVNKDEKQIYQEKEFSIGDDMIDTLSKNNSLDFQFVTQEKADNGLKNGRYYMVITLPKDMSQKATTLLTASPEKVTIDYQTTKGRSFVASKMSDTAMQQLTQEVSEKISKTYITTVFTKLSDLQNGLIQAAQGGEKLVTGSQQIELGSQQLSENLEILEQASNTLHTGSSQLTSGIIGYALGVSQLGDGLSTVSSGFLSYTNAVGQISDGGQKLQSNSEALLSGVGSLEKGIGAMAELSQGVKQLDDGLQQLSEKTEISPENKEQIVQLINTLPTLNQAIQNLNQQSQSSSIIDVNIESVFSDTMQMLQSIIDKNETDKANMILSVQSTAAYQEMNQEQKTEIIQAIRNSPSELDTIAKNTLFKMQELKSNLMSVQDAVVSLQYTQESVAQMAGVANQVLPASASALSNLSNGLSEVHDNMQSQVLPASHQIYAGTAELSSQLSQGIQSFQTGLTDYTNGVKTLSDATNSLMQVNPSLLNGINQLSHGGTELTNHSSALISGAQQVDQGMERLETGSQQLASGGNSLTNHIGQLTQGTQELTNSLGTASQSLSLVVVKEKNADYLAAPILAHHSDKDRVANNGSAMAPYMMSVSLMVVAISTNVIFANSLSVGEFQSKSDRLRRKIKLNGSIATISAIVLVLSLRLMGLSMTYPIRTVLISIVASWTLMALVTSLVSWNERYGSFVALILLLLQLGASAGTYPIELAPRFFKLIQPFLPMTYSVMGLRQTMAMSGDILLPLVCLAGFFFLFLLFGWLSYSPNKKQTNNA